MHNNHCAVKVSTKNIHNPLTPVATDLGGGKAITIYLKTDEKAKEFRTRTSN